MEPMFFGNWQGLAEVFDPDGYGGFGVSSSVIDGYSLIAAAYEIDGYDGAAIVILVRDGVLYEYESSHCSCGGLEWGEPTPTTVAALKMRSTGQYSTGGIDADGWARVIAACEQATAQVSS